MDNTEILLPKFFAFEDALMLDNTEEGAIEITEQQYNDALTAKMEGLKAFVKDGELIIYTGKVTAYLKSDCTQQKGFDDKTLVTDDYTLLEPTLQFDEWNGVAWVKNLDLAFNSEMNTLNEKHYQDVLSATNQYNIAVARDGSTEGDKVAAARANLADIDAQLELDQLAIITKYYGA